MDGGEEIKIRGRVELEEEGRKMGKSHKRAKI
jgi:hypothetical protein